MPERAEKRKQTRIIVILAAAIVLGLCICVVGGGLLFGAMQVADMLDRDEVRSRVVVETPRGVPRQEMPGRPPVRMSPTGAVVTEVIEGSPAARAGLQPGDIIVAVDGQRLGLDSRLAQVIGQYRPGDRVPLQIERPDQGTHEIAVELGKKPGQRGVAYLGVGYTTIPDLGMLLEEVPSFGHMEQPYWLPHGGRFAGVLIQEVIEDTPAAEAGLRAGDLLETLDGEQVEDPDALAVAIARRRPGSRVRLGVRDLGSGELRQVPVTLSSHPDDPNAGYLGVGIGGAMRMEGIWPEGTDPGRFRFFYHGPGGQEMPFDLDQLPIEPDDLPFWHGEELPFDSDDLPFFHREDMPLDPNDLPFFDHEDMPFHHDDADRDLEAPDEPSA